MQYLSPFFDKLRINKGDTLYITSDFKALAFYLFRKEKTILNLDDVLEYFKDRVGIEGTLFIPTFTWDFCKGITFDYLNSPAQIGSLPNKALIRKDFVRTKHPIYSFAIWGKNQDILTEKDYPDSFGENSIFSYLYAVNAKNLQINVSYKDSSTFIHHIEQKNKIPYRFVKEFTGEYIDKNGNKSIKTYSMFCRHLDFEFESFIDPINEDLITCGGVQEITNECGVIRLIELNKAKEVIEYDINNNFGRKIAYWKSPDNKTNAY